MFTEDQTALRVELASVYAEKDAQARDFELVAADLARAEARIAALETELVASREEVAQAARRSVELVAVAESLPLLEQRAVAEGLRADQALERLATAQEKITAGTETAKELAVTVETRDREIVELRAKVESNEELISAVYAMASAQRAVLELTKT
jgi:hypothetical protein